MFRSLITTTKILSRLAVSNSIHVVNNVTKPNLVSTLSQRHFSYLGLQAPKLLQSSNIAKKFINYENSRTVTKYSIRKGKRKSVKAVLKRFYRLHWGIWIRRITGCHKKLWKKSPPRKRRLRQHVFCNATQSHMLDKMVGSYWRKPKYYIDDPYAPYHTREEFRFTSKTPKPYFPPEER